MSTYGCEAWKSYNHLLGQMMTQAQKQLQELRRQIQDVNWQRKSKQTEAGEKLYSLESR